MGGDDSVAAPAVEFREYGLGYGSAGCRFGSGTEFIYQHQGLRIRLLEHAAHLVQEGAVGAQVVVYALSVAYVHHYPVENRQLRTLRGRDEHAPLEHVLQQTYGLEAYGLASGIGPGDEEYVLGGGEVHGQGNDFLAFGPEGLLQQRMTGLPEVHLPLRGYHRHARYLVQRHRRLRHYEVDFSYAYGSVDQVRHVRAQPVAELGEYPEYLPALREVQFADFVLYVDELHRLDEGGLAAGRFVIYETSHLPLVRGDDGDEHLSVAYGDAGVAFGYAFLLGLAEQGCGYL